MARSLTILPLLVLVACSAAPAPAPIGFTLLQRFTLSPPSYLEASTRDWAKRWDAATGIHLAVMPGGIPIIPESMGITDGSKECGGTSLTWYSIDEPMGSEMPYKVDSVELDNTRIAGCLPESMTLGHEIGHVLGGPLGHHAVSGMFAEHVDLSNGWKIDAAALDAVCEYALCTKYEPE